VICDSIGGVSDIESSSTSIRHEDEEIVTSQKGAWSLKMHIDVDVLSLAKMISTLQSLPRTTDSILVYSQPCSFIVTCIAPYTNQYHI
jgi:hypothetical protein